MIHLRALHKRMLVKGIVSDDVVEILSLIWQTSDQLIVTCQDSSSRLLTLTLSSADENQLECVNASMLPWELLPQNPGEEDMRSLTKREKTLLNQSLPRAGFKLQWNKEGGYSDWTYSNITYRVFHTNHNQSFIVLLEVEPATLPQNEPEFAIQPTSDALSTPDYTEQPKSTIVPNSTPWIEH